MLDQLIKQPFLGFPQESLKFLNSLSKSKNNRKEWFDEHRQIYEEALKQPMKDLIDNLAPLISKIDPEIIVGYKSIFRINRDIRFSKDKTPYKDYYSAAFAFYRIKAAELPHFYFQFNAKEFLFASGQYSTEVNNLRKIRSAIQGNFKEYKKIITEKKFVKDFGEVTGQSLVKLPKGYEGIEETNPDPLLIRSLKMKQFYVFRKYEPEVIFDDGLIEILINDIKTTYDFAKFLSRAIR